jgi:hypothetical protein
MGCLANSSLRGQTLATLVDLSLASFSVQALDAGTAAVLPDGLRSELEQLEESGGVRHLNDLKDQIQVPTKSA